MEQYTTFYLEQKFQEIGLEIVSICVSDDGCVEVFLPLADTGMLLYFFYNGRHWDFKCGTPRKEEGRYVSIHSDHRINWPNGGDEVGLYSRWYAGTGSGMSYIYEDVFFWYQLKRYAGRLF